MLTDTFITNMVARLGGRTDLQSLLLGIMNDVKETVLERQSWFPWFLEHDTAEDSTHLLTVAGSELVALPAGYLAQVEDSAVFLLDNSGEVELELAKCFYADALMSLAATDSTQVYSLRGKTMRIRGIPTEVRRIRMQYYKADAPFAAGTTNNWLQYARNVVYGEVGFVAADKYVKDYDMSQRFAQEAAKAWASLANETTARLEAGANRVKGEI